MFKDKLYTGKSWSTCKGQRMIKAMENFFLLPGLNTML
jgi:hypothetical protein